MGRPYGRPVSFGVCCGLLNRRVFLAMPALSPLAMAPPASGESSIRAKAGSSEIVITTTTRLAGAIHSLRWNDMEFIDSADHGRQLQSASSFDLAKSGPFWAECYNPTEAGSRRDGAGNRSTSRLHSIEFAKNKLSTNSTMAFWLNPGERSEGRPALNRTELSRHRLEKKVAIGLLGLPHAIDYQVTFHVPPGERHTMGQFEALTGYMPSVFNRFLTWNLSTGKTAPLDDGPGEQTFPVIFTTPEETHAMGIFTPENPQVPSGAPPASKPSYGRFRFPREKVVKWNCVFRVRDSAGIPPGAYSLRMFVAVGSLNQVTETLAALAKRI